MSDYKEWEKIIEVGQKIADIIEKTKEHLFQNYLNYDLIEYIKISELKDTDSGNLKTAIQKFLSLSERLIQEAINGFDKDLADKYFLPVKDLGKKYFLPVDDIADKIKYRINAAETVLHHLGQGDVVKKKEQAQAEINKGKEEVEKKLRNSELAVRQSLFIPIMKSVK